MTGGPGPDAPPGLLRLSVVGGNALDDETLTERMRALFPGGIEETRDARGRLELAAYAAPPLTLPADLGPWRIDPVEDARARVWREDHHGTLIGDRLWVGPPSERPLDGRLAVVIEQGHAFGSGAHATTTGCLELLCGLDGTGSVLDLGCGSGVLAIAAALLGNRPGLRVRRRPAGRLGDARERARQQASTSPCSRPTRPRTTCPRPTSGSRTSRAGR